MAIVGWRDARAGRALASVLEIRKNMTPYATTNPAATPTRAF
jgi:hypothetical protein